MFVGDAEKDLFSGTCDTCCGVHRKQALECDDVVLGRLCLHWSLVDCVVVVHVHHQHLT